MIETVVQVINALPTIANEGSKSPQEVFTTSVGMPEALRQPHIYHFQSYFYKVFYYVKPAHRKRSDKFAVYTQKGRLIGYANLYRKIY